jgi:TusA-related sulfurtransferase
MQAKRTNARGIGTRAISAAGGSFTELKRELGRVEPGELLRVTAHNGGAFVDIPAWCRMTGHTLVSSNHPSYVLRKKGTHSSFSNRQR